MATRRKKTKAVIPAYQRGREFKVILPPDISDRFEKQAKDEGQTKSRIINNDLARIPYLDQQAKLGELVRNMDDLLTRHSARETVAELTKELLSTLREMVKADEADRINELRAKVAR